MPVEESSLSCCLGFTTTSGSLWQQVLSFSHSVKLPVMTSGLILEAQEVDIQNIIF